MNNTLSPSKFMLIRQDTQRSSIPSQMSQSKHLLTLQSQSQKKTNQLLSKTLQYLNQSHDLALFSKKILIPKLRRNTFLQQAEQKKQTQRTRKLLQAKCKQSFQIGSWNAKTCKNAQNKEDMQFSNGAKSRSRRKDRNAMNQTSISISKIQILSSMQKEQTIAQQNLDNEDYLFLNAKRQGQSQSDKDEQPYLYPSQVPQQPKLKFQKSFANDTETSSFFRIRPKVKSMSKYDRDRHHQGMEKSMHYRSGSCEKGNTLGGVNGIVKNNEVSPFIKLLPVVSISKKTNQQESQLGDIFSTLKGILCPNPFGSKIERFNSRPSIKDQQLLAMQVKRISSYYQKSTNQRPQTQQCLYLLLAAISKDRNKDTIRIYKDDFAKIYINRYGRDKITNFFDYEYIEDYGSLLRMFTESILQFKVEEVMLMSFMMLDFDNDGLISHSDLFKMISILDKNLLVKKTIYTILKYVKENAKNQAIRDVCHEDHLRKENYTLKKYQFMVYMKDKKKPDTFDKLTENEQKESSLKINEGKKAQQKNSGRPQPTSPLRRHFSLKRDTQQSKRQFNYLKSFIQNMANARQPGAGHFWINFQRFKSMYPCSVPQIYYDMLYAAFGLKIPGIEYDELDYETPLIKPRKATVVEEEINEMDVIKERVSKMRATRRDLNSKLIKPDIKRHKRIKTMLD